MKIKKTVQLFTTNYGMHIILEPHEDMSPDYTPISEMIEVEFVPLDLEKERASKLAALDSKIEELKQSIKELEQKRAEL